MWNLVLCIDRFALTAPMNLYKFNMQVCTCSTMSDFTLKVSQTHGFALSGIIYPGESTSARDVRLARRGRTCLRPADPTPPPPVLLEVVSWGCFQGQHYAIVTVEWLKDELEDGCNN